MLPTLTLSRHARLLTASTVLALAAGCGTVPDRAGTLPAGMAPQQFQADLGGGLSVDYQIERKTRQDGRACYAFLTGHLVNRSGETLSRQTILDFNVFGGGKQIFRDLTSPVQDVPPNTRVMFGMVDSPVHKDGCPAYDRIEVKVRKVSAG